MQKLQKAWGGRGLQIVAINVGDSRETVAADLRKNRWMFTVALGGRPEPYEQTVFGKYRVRSYPTTYLVDAKGTVRYAGLGFKKSAADALARAVADLGLK